MSYHLSYKTGSLQQSIHIDPCFHAHFMHGVHKIFSCNIPRCPRCIGTTAQSRHRGIKLCDSRLHGSDHIGHSIAVCIMRVEEKVNFRVRIQQTAGRIIDLAWICHPGSIPQAYTPNPQARKTVQYKPQPGKWRYTLKGTAKSHRQTYHQLGIAPCRQTLLNFPQ